MNENNLGTKGLQDDVMRVDQCNKGQLCLNPIRLPSPRSSE